MRFIRYWVPVCVYAGLIFYLSSQAHPEQELPSFITVFSDKVLHAVEYAVLGGLCYRAFRWGTDDAWRDSAVGLAILAASLYGVSDEVHQAFVPFRDASWQDWLADFVGATVGVVILSRTSDLRPVSAIPDMRDQR